MFSHIDLIVSVMQCTSESCSKGYHSDIITCCDSQSCVEVLCAVGAWRIVKYIDIGVYIK